MESPLLVREAVEAGLVEPISERLGCCDAPAVVEVKFEETAVARSIRAEECFCVAEGVQDGRECLDLVCDPVLTLVAGCETEDLADEELGGL